MNARKPILILGLLLALLAPAGAQADFGIKSVSSGATDSEGNPVFQAGLHPFAYTVDFAMNLKSDENETPEGTLRDVIVDLPPGLVGNPTAAPRCTQAAFEGLSPQCPAESQVGIAHVGYTSFGGSVATLPVYNIAPPLGNLARFAFSVFGENSFLDASLRADDDYGVDISDITVPTGIEIQSASVTIWGVPADPGHDAERQCTNAGGQFFFGCSSKAPAAPFVTLPTSCGPPLATTISVDSFENTGAFVSKTAFSEDESETPTGLSGCNALEFSPRISSQPTTNLADSPTGLDFNLHQPQESVPSQPLGSLQRCSTGSWSGAPSEFEFQWLLNGAPIFGATDSTYVTQSGDAGGSLQCAVTAIDPAAAGPGHVISTPVTINPPPATAPPRPAQPTIATEPSGGPGEEIAYCEPGFWPGAAGFDFQWLKNGSPVSGANEEFLLIAAGEAPFTLQCEVTGSNAGGTVVAYSANKEIGSPPPPQIPDASVSPSIALDPSGIGLSTANLKDAVVTLPAGMTLNPSAGNGLGACSEEQIGYAPKAGQIHFSKNPQSCPNASKVGTLEAASPSVDHKVVGGAYLAKPYANPFGSLIALYLTIEDEQTGIVAKLAGKVVPDPVTGQLTTTFKDNPQLPIEDIDLHFFGGSRGALKTPLACGSYATTSTLTPWSAPEGADAKPSSSFATSVAASGSGTCPTSEAAAPNKPSFDAGTLAPAAGAYSPFVLKLSRADGSQQLTGLDMTLPKGLTGKLAGIPYCSEAQIAAAKRREAPNLGAVEKQSPSCPLASEVGSVTVGAGAGITPLHVGGHAYLAGPYKGAPLSLVIITPAVAGPFDLGAVVARTALYLNSETAQIHAVSDPLPSILQGIPLDLRSVAVKLDRPDFTLNPTSCDPMQILGAASTLPGQSAALTSPFQVGGCSSLKFKPKLSLSLKGGTRRTKHPALKAVLTYPKGKNANVSFAQVTLPHSAFLDTTHIRTICTRVQFAADACPKGAIYGFAKAFSPLLDKPVQGPVYLRSSNHELPDVVLALKGQVDVDLVGRVDTGKSDGIRNTFEAAPDAPISKVILEMKGGKKGLFVNSENLCSKPQRAIASYRAHNGMTYEAQPLIHNDCAKKPGSSKRRHGSH